MFKLELCFNPNSAGCLWIFGVNILNPDEAITRDSSDQVFDIHGSEELVSFTWNVHL